MKRLLIEYQVFLSQMHEIKDFMKKIDKNTEIEKIEKIVLEQNTELNEYVFFLRSLSGSQLVYNAIIISLYGCLENYIDRLFGAYLEILSEHKLSYNDLPNNLREKYRAKFGEFLSNPKRFNNMDLDLEREVENYYHLLKSNISGTINKGIALAHSGNLHADEIFLLLKELGIEESKVKILDSHLFRKFHLENGMDEMEFRTKRARKSNDFFLPLENLIIQRNSVAHSWNVEDRIKLQEINDVIIPFVLVFCESIFRLTSVEAFLFNTNMVVFENEEPISVYDNRIVCFNNQNHKMAIGDYIVYISGDKVQIARIENIQLNGTDIEAISESEAKDIGVQIDNIINKEDKLKFVINAMR